MIFNLTHSVRRNAPGWGGARDGDSVKKLEYFYHSIHISSHLLGYIYLN